MKQTHLSPRFILILVLLTVIKYQIILSLKGQTHHILPFFNGNIIWYFMTTRSAIENQVYHVVIWLHIFVQLFLYWLYSFCKTPCDGYRSDRNKLMKTNNVWLDILINVYLLVCCISIKHSLVPRHGTHKCLL